VDYSVHTDGSGFVSGGYIASTERRTEQGNQCVPVSVGCKFSVVDVLFSVWMVSFLVCVVGALVGIDSDYFDKVLPYLKACRVYAHSVPVVGDLCRVLKFCYLAAELGSLFLLYRKDLVTLKHESCSCKVKTLREEAHSRVMKMLLTQPRSARESASGLFVLGNEWTNGMRYGWKLKLFKEYLRRIV